MGKTLTLGERLLLERRRSGMSQEELGKLSGVSRSYIKSIETGSVTNVGVDFIAALANALEISPAYLVGYTDSPLNEPDDVVLKEAAGDYIVREMPNPVARRLSAEMLDVFAALDIDSQRSFINLLHNLRGEKGTNAAAPDSPPAPT